MTMMNSIKLFFFLFFLLLRLPSQAMQEEEAFAVIEIAYKQDQNTPSLPEQRKIEQETMQELKADEDMHYQLSNPENNFLTQFLNWLILQFVRLFGNKASANAIEVIFYMVSVAALSYAILRLLNVDISGLFSSRNRKATLKEQEGSPQENIHEIDFQTAIAEAIKEQEYNKAVRLLYLSALKELSAREHIRWQAGKTNYQYQQELSTPHLQDPFRQLGFFFEYAWYGDFRMNERHYQQAESMYQSLHQNLQKGA